MATLALSLHFGGGMELLFDNRRDHEITITLPAPADVRLLIDWIATNLLQERKELFLEGPSLRPGILVLINDTDWELEGEEDYQLKDGDDIVFISTLHGG
ncbi:hypothetical protein BOTBODRAFT_179198 [Botryobasidium botryosum FD-172 SS1]|uniref:Ubiquitin-related modifier 1 n=1 Tax=Botryobasidium botryosum (strain FD-172 SS1) TaxID=930990 RepID=A0A067MBC4_BOTB1|nr:hypothetical protein BOTBODRAFT_179198 [Botryobasidium botryosum FD-172 SS1]